MKKFIDETLAGLDALPISAVVEKMFSRLDWKLPISLETPFENDLPWQVIQEIKPVEIVSLNEL